MGIGENVGECVGENTESNGYRASAAAVSGTFADGNTITLTGSGFGANGPTYLVEWFDGGANGDAFTTSNTIATSVTGTLHEFYNGEYLSKTMSGWFRSGDALYFDDKFGTFNEVYLNYSIKTPNVGTFACKASWECPLPSQTLSTDSVWKPIWLLNNGSTVNGDLCIPTYVNQWMLSGNDIQLSNADAGYKWNKLVWSWTGWNTFSFSGKANVADPINNNGDIRIEFWSDQVQSVLGSAHFSYETSNLPLFVGSSGNTTWTDIRLNSYLDGGYALFDHLYMAAGTYANARVVVTDNATYASSTRVSIQPHATWSDTSVTVTANVQDFASETAYFHVIPAGYPEAPVYVGSLSAP